MTTFPGQSMFADIFKADVICLQHLPADLPPPVLETPAQGGGSYSTDKENA